MKVLVTGAAGFIGSNLVRYLAEKRPDWQIFALDSLSYAGNLENIADLLDGGKCEFIKADIVEYARIASIFAEHSFDLVFHLAAESHVDRSNYGAAAFVRTNVMGTDSLLAAAQKQKVGRFVHISTDEVYGSLGPSGAFSEMSPLNPTNPYAASKAGSDLLVLSYHKTHSMNAVVTRCTNNYGPYQFPEKLIPLFITNALQDKKLPLYGDGMNVRSWIYVEDHCEALLTVAESGKAGEVYNIGSPSDGEVPNKEVTLRILQLLGKSEELIERVADRPAHDRRYAIDHSKLSAELGWQPRTTFREGLESTVKWYGSNRSWWERIKSGEYMEFYQLHYGERECLGTI